MSDSGDREETVRERDFSKTLAAVICLKIYISAEEKVTLAQYKFACDEISAEEYGNALTQRALLWAHFKDSLNHRVFEYLYRLLRLDLRDNFENN